MIFIATGCSQVTLNITRSRAWHTDHVTSARCKRNYGNNSNTAGSISYDYWATNALEWLLLVSLMLTVIMSLRWGVLLVFTGWSRKSLIWVFVEEYILVNCSGWIFLKSRDAVGSWLLIHRVECYWFKLMGFFIIICK